MELRNIVCGIFGGGIGHGFHRNVQVYNGVTAWDQGGGTTLIREVSLILAVVECHNALVSLFNIPLLCGVPPYNVSLFQLLFAVDSIASCENDTPS